MHNVNVESMENTAATAGVDPSSASLAVHLEGTWNTDQALVQFTSEVGYPQGSVTMTADFPSMLGGQGRAPTPLAYCFYGAMCCYGSTFATQAAMAGVELTGLRISLDLDVDFRTALGVGDFPPMSSFAFRLEVDTEAPDEDLDRVKQLTDERCPAIWAMNNPVPHTVEVARAG